MKSAVEPRDLDCPPDADSDAVERDLRMVCEAIALVASGAATRVVVANIHYGGVVLSAAGRIALGRGIRVRPIWRPDMEADLAVESIAS